MSTTTFSSFLLVLFWCASCRGPTTAPTSGSSSTAAADKSAQAASEKIGILAPPLDAATFRFWPQAYSGPLLLTEIVPQGTVVRAGDVVARLDSRAIDDELHQAELELESTRVSHAATLERNRLEEGAAGAAQERARASLERTRRSLAGWKEQELAFERRSDELGRAYEQANVDDQNDELDQLTKMYQADELVDATEDIVIKRSKRGLALTGQQNQLSRDRAKYHEDLELALQTEQREEAQRAESEALERLVAQQEIEARTRRDAAARSAATLAQQEKRVERLRADREDFVIEAWREGVFLHGGPKEYRPGKAPARYDRGDGLPTRVEVFTIADPDPALVAFEVTDAELARFADGTVVEAHPIGAAVPSGAEGGAKDGEGAARGVVTVEPYPRNLATNERTLDASAKLEHALSGARYGMRVRLTPAEAKTAE